MVMEGANLGWARPGAEQEYGMSRVGAGSRQKQGTSRVGAG